VTGGEDQTGSGSEEGGEGQRLQIYEASSILRSKKEFGLVYNVLPFRPPEWD